MARTHETLSRLLHLLQHLAARIGLLPNGSKCQLIVIHGSLPISLSLHADSHSTCTCPYCAPLFHVCPREDSLDTPWELLQSAKYLGSFITPTSSSVPDVNFRCSQASSAFKALDPFFDIPLSPKQLDFEFAHKYCRPFSSMDRNVKSTPKPTPPLKLPGSTAYTIKHPDPCLKLRAHASTELYCLQILLARRNIDVPFHILFFQLVSLSHPSVSLIQG